MCLFTTQKKPFIAKKNMIVFKVLNVRYGNITSYVQEFQYVIDKIYKTTISEADPYDKNVSCADSIDMEFWNKKYPKWGWKNDRNLHPELRCFIEGFHSYGSYERILKANTLYFAHVHSFECIIPKGSEYYRDPTGLIVSNQIIIKKEVL